MTIIDIIKERKSVRSYTGVALDEEKKIELKNYINGLSQPLGGKARIEIVGQESGSEPVKLGTYGVISGARDFLVLIYEDGPLAAANAGYLFEQVILYCTELGLGTCWLGGTFKKTVFATNAKVKDIEIMRIVSPVGYSASRGKFLDRIMRAGAGSAKRKPFDEIFFDGSFDKVLNRGSFYDLPLEMVRLAPSATNSQTWRAVVANKNVHFYYQQKSHLSDIDMGIALCHFELTCKEVDIRGRYSILTDIPVKTGMNYLISWVFES